ncbi:MAG: hypothetical protein J6V52_01705 [Bacteroidaceae bacterium]|nr:hypothetical protein [Bacteroidaceae bacterium]
MWIRYDRGDYGYQIYVVNPSEKYPMFQVCCNDDEFQTGTRVFKTEEEVKEYVDFILSKADAWVVME